MREHPALGHLHALRQATDGQAFKAGACGQLAGSRQDGKAGLGTFTYGQVDFLIQK
jgi:hypothetical protein